MSRAVSHPVANHSDSRCRGRHYAKALLTITLLLVGGCGADLSAPWLAGMHGWSGVAVAILTMFAAARLCDRVPEASDRPAPWWIAIALTSFAGLVVVAAITAWLFRWAGGQTDSGPGPIHYTLLTTNLLLVFALFASVARYLIRLLAETRAGILGSRFKLKLVASVIGLCLLPSVVLALVALFVPERRVELAVDDVHCVEPDRSNLRGGQPEIGVPLDELRSEDRGRLHAACEVRHCQPRRRLGKRQLRGVLPPVDRRAVGRGGVDIADPVEPRPTRR